MQVLKGKEILVIDDDKDFRTMIRKILEADGASVVEGSSIRQGFSVAEAHAPHLIILDLIMPDETGFDFLHKRKDVATLKNTPILILSGQRDVPSIHRAISLGAKDYLLKPFRANFLLQKVRKALHTHTFLSYKFHEKMRPIVNVTSPIEITQANEVGFIFESSIKLGPETKIEITSPLLDSMGCAGSLMLTTNTPPRYVNLGRYLNEINLIGMSKKLAKDIRALIKGWK